MSDGHLLNFGGRRQTPFVRQSEASECGLACLAMVASFHGLEMDMTTLRRQFGVSLRGSTLKALMQIADQLGLGTRAIRADMPFLDELNCPVILHWNLNHFVVLVRVRQTIKGKRFWINDPAQGIRVLDETELSRSFTGVALEVTKTAQFHQQSASAPLKIKQLWSGLRGAGAAFGGVVILSAILELVALAMPLYLQLGIDTVLPATDRQLLLVLAVGFGGLAVINALAGWIRSISILNMTNAFSFQVINNLYRHMMSLPLSWFEKRHVGDIISRFNSSQSVTDFVSQGLVSAVIDGIMAFITLLLMVLYSGELAAIAILGWVLYCAVRIGAFQAMRSANANSITANARESSAFIESVRGVSTVKAFGQELARQRTWQALKAAAINAQLKLGRITARFDTAAGLVLAVERILFVYVAVGLALKGGFTVGMLFAFQAYKQQFMDAATRLVDQSLRYKLIEVHLTRVADIALSRPEPPGLVVGTERSIQGEIELRNVSFRYGACDPYILSNINLRIIPGEAVVFLGPSGCGKTTLLKIMMGLLEPTAGAVLIDGRPLGQIGVRQWRAQIGSVLQEDKLFAGSLAENIAFFDPFINLQEVREACAQAAVLDEIEAMPLALETLVGDMGSSLSGGQRQRIMLARALYAKPVALFMDEGTAHLDPPTEARALESIAKLPVTRILSAHKPQALEIADRLILVQNGCCIELRRSVAA